MRNLPVATLVIALSAPLAAQWLTYRDPRIPRTRDGKPDLAAAAPRTADGKCDLSGVWGVDPSENLARRPGNQPSVDPLDADRQFISKYAINILADFKPGEEPMRPEA